MANFGWWIEHVIPLLRDPGRALALVRGQWCRLYYHLRGINLQVGPRFHLYGRLRIERGANVVIGRYVKIRGLLRIQGGGEVVLGDYVNIFEGLRIRGPGRVTLGERVIVWEDSDLRTHTRESRITIGDRTKIRGPEFNCVRSIEVGTDCMIAPVMILDADFHSTRADRHSEDALVRVVPVHVGDNVWIGDRAALLPGTRVGRNSVVGFGAICMREYPEDVIILGNPARVSAPIPAAPESQPMDQDSTELRKLYITRRELTGRGAT